MNCAREAHCAVEGGVDAVAVATGQAALHYAVLNLVGPGQNLVSAPQLYGTTYTLFSHVLPSLGVEVRFAPTTSRMIARQIDSDSGNIL